MITSNTTRPWCSRNGHHNTWVTQRSTRGISREFRQLLRILSRVPARPNPYLGLQAGVRKYAIGRAPEYLRIASLTRAAAARYDYAMNTSLFDQIRQLSVEEQIELVEALWDNIVERNAVPGPTEAQKAELDRRLSEHAAHPDDVVPWSEVKDSALTRIRR